VVYFSFGFLATVIFGAQYDSFGNMNETFFATQFDMMIGGLEYVPDGFSQDILLMIYICSFFVIMFFFMLNFLLSIIVDAYLRVKLAIDQQETEQNFVVDISSIFIVGIKSYIDKWPDPVMVAEKLKSFTALLTVNPSTLAAVVDDADSWDRASRIRFVQHYKKYDFLEPKKAHLDSVQSLDHAIEEVEKRVAMVLGVQAPTLHERMAISKRKMKQPEKFETKFKRLETKIDDLADTVYRLVEYRGPGDNNPNLLRHGTPERDVSLVV
jgi:hypothetical protein